jgi:hypothetical protein
MTKSRIPSRHQWLQISGSFPEPVIAVSPGVRTSPGLFPGPVIAGKRKVFPERRLAEKTAGPPPETAYKTFLGSFCEFYDKM